MQRFYANLLMLTLLLTFVGQSVASVTMLSGMPSMHAKIQVSKNVGKIDVSSQHAMGKMECCEEQSTSKNECSCPINGCTANAMLNIKTLFCFALFQSEKINVSVLSEQTTLPKLLYRPPMPA